MRFPSSSLPIVLVFMPFTTTSFRPHQSIFRHRLLLLAEKEPTTNGFNQAVIEDANEALQSVGWSVRPSDELTSEDPFVKAIDASIQAEMGVGLDELLNPAKVSGFLVGGGSI